mgnify:CR=1 FL=1
MKPLDLQKTHVGENIQTGQQLPQAQGRIRPADDLTAKAHRRFLKKLPFCMGQVTPYHRQHRPVGQQLPGLGGGEGIGAKLPVTGGAAGTLCPAGRPDIQNVHLHRPLSPELIDLGVEGHIHHISHLNEGAFRSGGEIDGVQTAVSLPEPAKWTNGPVLPTRSKIPR